MIPLGCGPQDCSEGPIVGVDRQGRYYAAAMPPVINLLDPASYAHGQPHQQYQWLREHDPIHRHSEPDGPGFWAVTRYHDVKAVGRDPAMFSSSPTIMIAA